MPTRAGVSCLGARAVVAGIPVCAGKSADEDHAVLGCARHVGGETANPFTVRHHRPVRVREVLALPVTTVGGEHDGRAGLVRGGEHVRGAVVERRHAELDITGRGIGLQTRIDCG